MTHDDVAPDSSFQSLYFILPQGQFWWCVAWFPSPFKNSRGIFNVILAVYAPWDAPHYMPPIFCESSLLALWGLRWISPWRHCRGDGCNGWFATPLDDTWNIHTWSLNHTLGYVWYRSCQQKSLWGSRSKHKNLCISRESGDDVFAFYTWWLKDTKKHSQHDRLCKSGPLQSQKTVT